MCRCKLEWETAEHARIEQLLPIHPQVGLLSAPTRHFFESYLCAYKRLLMYVYTCMNIRMYVYVYMYVYTRQFDARNVYTYACVYKYIYIHISTYI